ncbi:alpha/beta fold hydrolase [Barrientosiimonas endolithica]|uniref:AB hydrolase-1 domain-containing protein n=1 Tax=Barrientosiimonas endolithica TaxID=1535208 RepID=A0ABM8HFM0_9MICO|nr:alpha/beta fold hydrolase [Barrientosiimonas endolithica]BDZ59832.1 hypothetical protein GCM10025872_34890 [Barrientosiimonas endolithica]
MATLSTEIVGEGTPVVALHGFGPDRRLMAGMLEPVFAGTEGYRRIYLDLPGCGSSAAREIRSTPDVLAAVEQALADTVGDEPYLLVGESYGGYLAAELARQRRSRCGRSPWCAPSWSRCTPTARCRSTP